MTSKQSTKLLNLASPITYSRSDFELQRKLGDGAFGQVWRARHKQSSAMFAVKQVQKTKVMRILDQFKREVEIMYMLDHPHLVKLFGHFEDEKFFYLILELVEGGNLFQKLSREKILTERSAAQVFREIILAVEYLHTRSPVIIHRDIKPENIMIDKTGRVKLTDFGWANFVNRTSERMTACGTLEYLPPEMVDEKGHDTCADIWCLGILLFEMLAGSTPFKASGKEKTMKNITSSCIKFPLGFSHIAKDLIQQMLEKDKSRRIDIFHVKIHRWLTIILPIRETLVQNFAPKALKTCESSASEPNDKSEKLDEVKTMYSENDTDEDLKYLAENAFRKSLQQLKTQLTGQASAVKSQRNSLQECMKQVVSLEAEQKALEERIEDKKKEIVAVVLRCKETLSRSFDANLDLERLQSFDSLALAEQVKDHQQKYLEGKKQAQLQQAYLESLKARVKALAAGQSDSEKTLRLLTKQLTELRQSDVASRSRHKSDISQLQFSLDTLKSKVSEKDQVICSFSQFDKHQAKEISEIIRTKMEGAKDFSRTLSKKIETAEDSANELEQLISELAIDYEMKKSQKLHYLRKRKDEFLRNSRKAREDLRLATVKNNETSRVELKFQLSAARKFHYCAEQSQIDAGRKRMEVKAI